MRNRPVAADAARREWLLLSRAVLAGALGLGGVRRALALDGLQHLPHPHLGTVSLLLPAGWRLASRSEAGSDTLFVTLQPPMAGAVSSLFDLQLTINETSRFRHAALARRELDAWLQEAMAAALPQSVEGRIAVQRFGLRREPARYARLTDKAPPPGDFNHYTMGARLSGAGAVLFTLYDSDASGALLQRVLDLVGSITFDS
jgi:hypothetical protein